MLIPALFVLAGFAMLHLKFKQLEHGLKWIAADKAAMSGDTQSAGCSDPSGPSDDDEQDEPEQPGGAV